MTQEHTFTNDLIHEKSPYLLQHAHNPVNWLPWNPTTWENAKKLNKPVIVSIGYSTCHWCHVMEHESFEDVSTAEFMNEHFICIKVDREERPDVDMVYMDACQLMTGRGGWPLNAVCLPDKRPVFAGTYFPKENWHSILLQLTTLWQNDKPKMLEYAEKIQHGIQQINIIENPILPVFNRKDLLQMAHKSAQDFDMQNGGLLRNQKFPMPTVYEYLLDEYLISGDKELLKFINFTLIKMANGGIYDQLRGGFYRYTVDTYWFAPHFEKMLYDNAQLISLYSRAHSVTDAALFKTVVQQTIEFVFREMHQKNGGFYAALDADSEGIEGKFYVFTWEELQHILSDSDLEFAAMVYDLKPEGNWEHRYNILSKPLSTLQLLESTGLDIHTFNDKIQRINGQLFLAQETRIRPGLDTKIICSWNSLMLKALADAGRYLESEQYLAQAADLADWMMENHYKNNRLIRTTEGVEIPAFAEDYACFISGLIALFEATGNGKWLEHALKLTDYFTTHFYNHEKNLFAFTPISDETLMVEKTDVTDDVIPSNNSMMAIALQKLGILCDRADLLAKGGDMMKALRHPINLSPLWYSNWAKAAQAEALGWLQIGATGALGKSKIKALQKHLPSWAITAYETENNCAFIKEKQTKKDAIFICVNATCFEPVNSTDDALEILADIIGE
ncbi:MAG: thioredoxin domain-containing protein [Bacteroidia bacterium]|nr:thioredoxin domain-containing protein [Bacteroidia bacterium]